MHIQLTIPSKVEHSIVLLYNYYALTHLLYTPSECHLFVDVEKTVHTGSHT